MISNYYYLFGLDAIYAYNESLSNLITKLKEDSSAGTTYHYNEKVESPTSLLSSFSGWGDYIEISKAEYLYIDSFDGGDSFTLVDEFLQDYCTEVQPNEDPAYVELKMDNHICIDFQGKQWYVPKDNMLWNDTDTEYFDFLNQHFKL